MQTPNKYTSKPFREEIIGEGRRLRFDTEIEEEKSAFD